MDNSIYISLSRQMTLFRDLDVTANNIANINTVGYNGEKLAFENYLVRERTSDDRERIAFARDPLSYRDTRNGRVEKTENPLDVAINGPGYFQVQTPLGVRYTKAGNFQLNETGNLVTLDGHQVLGSDGAPVNISPEVRDIEILGGGSIRSNGEEIATLGIVEFESEQRMERVGNNLYKSEDAALPALQSRAMQGHLEYANVNGVTELTRLIELQRSVGSSSKFIETMYDLERKVSSTYTKQV